MIHLKGEIISFHKQSDTKQKHFIRFTMAIITESLKYDILLFFVAIITTIYLLLKRKYTYWERNGFKTLPDYKYLWGHLKTGSFHTVNKELYKASTDRFNGIYAFLRPISS